MNAGRFTLSFELCGAGGGRGGSPGAGARRRGHDGVFAALGIHPHYAGQTEEGYEGFLENRLRNEAKVVALGECGLDYHYDKAPRLLQRGVFLNQLEIARRVGMPVVLHVREAHADAQAILRDFPELRFAVHCFTGTPSECQGWLSLGAYIGITGIVTYKNAAEVRESAKLVPADRLLVETDAPYLSPEPVRKMKTNEPANVAHTAKFLAELRGTTLEELAEQTTANAARFFGERWLA
jgi:TatD DNase family protein